MDVLLTVLTARGLEQECRQLRRVTAPEATEDERTDLANLLEALDLAIHYDKETRSLTLTLVAENSEIRERVGLGDRAGFR